MKKIITLIKHNKGVILFSVLKYIEIAITSLSTFLLAKKIGPEQLGLSVPIFLYITYANYLALGLNQVVTKNFSRIEDGKKIAFITINFQYLLFIAIVNLLLARLILVKDYFIYAACISILIIFRGYFSSYYRSIHRVRVLNINNILFSSGLLFGVTVFVNQFSDYLEVWLLLLFGAVISYLLVDLRFFSQVLRQLFVIPKLTDVKFNFSEGVKLALTGFIMTFFLTYDRLILNYLDVSLEIKGSFQLADYIGMAIYMIATTIIFYFFPQWVKNIRENNFFAKKFLYYCNYLLLSIPFLLGGIYLISILLVPFLFPEYPNLLAVILCVVFSKFGVISLSFSSLLYIGKDKENEFLRLLSLPIIFLAGFMGLVLIFNVDNYLIIPIIGGVILFGTCVSITLWARTKGNILE